MPDARTCLDAHFSHRHPWESAAHIELSDGDPAFEIMTFPACEGLLLLLGLARPRSSTAPKLLIVPERGGRPAEPLVRR